jgi:uncharacterized protein
MNIPTKAAPFHPGELRAQQLAGGGPPGFAIREAMPEQHRTFFSMLRYVLLATSDNEGWPVASIVTGPQGFVTSAEIDRLAISADAVWLDGVKPLLYPGKPVGMLGIDLSTRRRNRVNGVVGRIDDSGIHLDVTQSFGNCPKYIQVRDVEDNNSSGPSESQATQTFTELDDKALSMIANADTFFVATSSGPEEVAEGGLDISHKGGRPGFIHMDGNTLTIPDFVGNRYFNTLGNILIDPRAAILIVDFASGDVLHLQGTSEVLWNSEEAQQLAGAQRLWRFHVKRGWHAKQAVALRWALKEVAPTTQATGIWAELTV